MFCVVDCIGCSIVSYFVSCHSAILALWLIHDCMNVVGRKGKPKILDIKMLHMVMERKSGGDRVPFSIVYLCRDGSIMSEDRVVCVGVNRRKGTRTLQFLSSAERVGESVRYQTRTIRDCLVLMVDDFKVVAS